MKKIKIEKQNIKPFILGVITTLVVIGIIIYGGEVVDSFTKKETNDNNKENEVIINNKKYRVNEIENDNVCSAYKDAVIKKYNYLISKDRNIYELNDKKYSDTNENCKLLDESIKVQSIFDGYFITDNNDIYRFEYNNDDKIFKKINNNEYIKEKSYIFDYIKNNDVKYMETYDDEVNYDTQVFIEKFLVLKNDGKIYMLTYKGKNINYDIKYSLDSEEVFQDIKDENIKSFLISKGNDNGYIITNKNIYVQTIKNKECKEYADIQCEYKYVKLDYLSKYVDSIIDFNYYENDFDLRLQDKVLYFQRINE